MTKHRQPNVRAYMAGRLTGWVNMDIQRKGWHYKTRKRRVKIWRKIKINENSHNGKN